MKALSKPIIVMLASLALPVMGFTPWAAAAQAGAVNDGERGALFQAKESFGRLPMSFEPNQGQSNERVSFLSRGSEYNLFLTREESVLVLRKATPSESRSPLQGPPHLRHAPSKFETPSVVRMKFPGANSEVKIEGAKELPGRANYLNSGDPGKWRTDVAQYARVEYHDLYPDVDLVYYGNQTGKEMRLEHDFVVRPGGDPAKIRLGFEGVERVEVNASGDLVLRLPDGSELIQHAPVIYQESDGSKKTVDGGYVIIGSNPEAPAKLPSVGFNIAQYDPGKTLYIDPQLSYSTYLGGSDYDFGYGIAVDGSGCAYITGWTYSMDFPTTTPLQLGNAGGADVFVAKLNASGNALVYSTFVGGSGDDFGTGIAVNTSDGSAYVTGYTNSADFPITTGAISTANKGLHDAFVFKIDATGTSLVYSTYLGGTGDDFGTAIAVNSSSGTAYVTGYTNSTDFPTVAAYQAANAGLNDAFVAEISADGTTLIYSTYIGGSLDDYATAIALDTNGLVYVTGYTKSTNYPTANPYKGTNAGGWDAFITVLAASGSSTTYSTYLGGAGDDFAYGIAVATDSASPNHLCAYVTGSTSSANFPTLTSAISGYAYQTSIAGNYDAFVSKVDVDPSLAGPAKLVYSTYLGGEDFDAGNGIVVDSLNNAYIVGETWSQSFPVKGNAFQQMLNGTCDAFVAELNSTGSSLTYSSYMGGSDNDAAMAVALDSTGNLYLTGYTYSADFPVVAAMAGRSAGSSDAFAAKISTAAPPLPDLIVSAITVPVYGIAGQKISVTNSVRNMGVGVAPPSKLGLYLSTTLTTTPWMDNRSIFLGSRNVPKLKFSAGSTVTTTVAIPPNVPMGSYYLVAAADSGGIVSEGNDAKRTMAKPITIYTNRPADLVATSVAGPTTARVGQTITVTSTVKNQGIGPARNFYIGMYLSTSTVISPSNTLLGNLWVSNLPPGSSTTSTSTVQIPMVLTPGTYYFGLIADNGNNVSETNKNNNTKTGNKIVISP